MTIANRLARAADLEASRAVAMWVREREELGKPVPQDVQRQLVRMGLLVPTLGSAVRLVRSET